MPESALIAGMGPGFCEALAWKLAREGHSVAMFARSAGYLEEVEVALTDEGHDALGLPVDVTDPDAVTSGVGEVRERLGPIDVLAHTASTVTDGETAELDPDRLERMWRLYCYGGLLCFRTTLEDLQEQGGTALFFGAPPAGGDFAFKSAKDGNRGLARSLAEEYGPEGIHVAHVIIDGRLLNPDVYDGPGEIDEDAFIDPGAAAETCYHLVEQPARGRTFELDLHAHARMMQA